MLILKRKISLLTGIPLSKFCVIYKGLILNDIDTIDDIDYHPPHSIYLHIYKSPKHPTTQEMKAKTADLAFNIVANKPHAFRKLINRELNNRSSHIKPELPLVIPPKLSTPSENPLPSILWNGITTHTSIKVPPLTPRIGDTGVASLFFKTQ